MQRHAGFTLIEMLITVAVLSVLAAIAYPSYQDHVRKSRRAQAQSLLMDISTRQQQRLLDVRSYAASNTDLNISIPSAVSPYYTITINAPAGAAPPTFTASAAPLNSQVQDKCGTLGIDNTSTKTAIKGGSAQSGCW